MVRQLQLIGGIVLLVCGLLGLILPIIPGIPLLIAGAALLGFDHPLIRPFARRFEQWRQRHRRSPSTGEASDQTRVDQNHTHGAHLEPLDGARPKINVERESTR